ncbi:hypothetical protein [Aeromicrobium sp. CF3.5]|uniref:hypothetical protein n=1 Tax=Aeromicrobium sp. CF3.5 TaxID=3373078 RepID=UPI003EE557BA
MPEGPTFTTRLVRIVHVLLVASALVHLVLVCAQPFLAGWSLDGDGDALDLHGINGSIIVTISMILIPLGVLWWRPGRGTVWVPTLAVVLFAAETLQLGMGYADILVVHVPLGVGVLLGSFVLLGLAVRSKHRANREAQP